MKTKNAQNIALACLSLELNPNEAALTKAPAEIQLTPAGYFRAVDGRPDDAENGWYIDASLATVLKAQANTMVNEFVIDYEHQTLHKEKNGQPAPAAGWFKRLEWREGQGLFAIDVKWTPQAELAILNGEYRYLSPVFTYEPQTGRVLTLRMAALTNSPGLDGMQSLASLTLEQFNHLANPSEETSMDKELKLALGLPEDATKEQVMAALTQLQTKAAAADEADTQIAALTAQIEANSDAQPDPAKYVPIEMYNDANTQLAALTQQQAAKNVETVVDKAIADNLLRPAEKDWAINLGKSNMASLTQQIQLRQPMAALSAKQVDAVQTPPEKTAVLTAEQKQVAKVLGIPESEYQAQLQAEQGDNA
ncbi:phage protease [Thiomicrorhabdus indica]|uniref:phage protease n=1 Tax=Thiomicrorhabdus indica TaxID=2267253 RepID=UPI002AA663A7|nr:phage protease [Thiomicrorhabdus indica]